MHSQCHPQRSYFQRVEERDSPHSLKYFQISALKERAKSKKKGVRIKVMLKKPEIIVAKTTIFGKDGRIFTKFAKQKYEAIWKE